MRTLTIDYPRSMFPSYLTKAALLFAGSVLLTLSQGSIQAVDRADGGPFGIRVSVNTNGYRFQQPLVQDATGRGGSFSANAIITNGSRTAVPFSFPQGLAEEERILFKVYNSDGDEVWRSQAAPAGEPVQETLRGGRSWKGTARIPLVLNGVALPAGTYSVEAGLANGDPVLASTIFEVTPRPTGTAVPVNGFVLKSSFDGNSTQFHSFAAGAVVEAFRMPEGDAYPWLSGQKIGTNSDGQFSATAATGRYEIRALLHIHSTPVPRGDYYIGVDYFAGGAVTVSVSESKVCRPVIMLSAGGGQQQIHGTGEVTISRDAADPATVTVKAKGAVNSGGWFAQLLVSRELTTDGILLLDFMAHPPLGAATQAFETVNATVKMPLLPGMKGVQVRSQTNAVTAMLAE
jgi:hypothetical protein